MPKKLIFKQGGLNNAITPSGYKSLGLDNITFSEKDSSGNVIPLGGRIGYEYYTAVTITSGQILTLNSNPTEVLPTLIGDKYYDFKVYFEYTFGTTPYTTDAIRGLRFINISGNTVLSLPLINGVSENFSAVLTQIQSTVGNINSNIRLFQPTSDPTVGDGTIKLKIYYNIVSFG